MTDEPLTETVFEVTVKVALVAPAATVNDVGTVATLLVPLVSDTTAPPVGALPVSVTVPVELALPPTTVVGFRVRVDTLGAVIVSVPEALPL